jgi:hypothetical protein
VAPEGVLRDQGRPSRALACATPVSSPEHKTTLHDGLNVTGMWTAVCTCGRVIGDGPREEVAQQARDHEQSVEPPWVIPPGERREPWRPGDPTG